VIEKKPTDDGSMVELTFLVPALTATEGDRTTLGTVLYQRATRHGGASLQSAQHLGKALDHRTELTIITALVRATSQLPTDDQDQLPVRIGPIRIGVA
jgi:hypothetical protein